MEELLLSLSSLSDKVAHPCRGESFATGVDSRAAITLHLVKERRPVESLTICLRRFTGAHLGWVGGLGGTVGLFEEGFFVDGEVRRFLVARLVLDGVLANSYLVGGRLRPFG